MELKKYTREQQKALVEHWNHYYGKGFRTLEDITEFSNLVDRRLDDVIRLMILETFTDFYKNFGAWNPRNSLCNMIYLLSSSQRQNPTPDTPSVDGFLDLVTGYFNESKLRERQEELAEKAFEEFEQTLEKTEQQQTDIFVVMTDKKEDPEPKKM